MCLLMRNFFCVENTLIFETCLCKLSSSYNIFIVIFSIRILFFVARNFNYKKIGSSFKLICDLPFKLKFCTQHNILIFWLVVGMTFCWYNLGKQKCILQANCFTVCENQRKTSIEKAAWCKVFAEFLEAAKW